MKKTLIFIFIILLVLSIGTVSATNENNTITADTNIDIVADAPKSITDLQNTINNNNDTIILNDNYQFTEKDKSTEWSGRLVLKKGVIIDKSITIDGQGHTIDAKHKIRIFQVTNNANVVLKNINFLNGNVYEVPNSFNIGGAVWNKEAKDLTVINCTFIGNEAVLGGALNDANVINCTFKNNYAHYGGAIYSLIDKISVTNSEFIDNTASYEGGAIYTPNNLLVKDSLFKNNKLEGSLILQCYGGAISCGKNLEYDSCIFDGNHADDYGGAIYANTIYCSDNPSFFINNYVDDNQGGAIYTNKFETDVANTVFINNTVKSNDDGGAIYINKENHITFSHCYFQNNSCGDEGGAIYLDSRYSHLTLKYNLFINNHAGDKGNIVYNKGYYDKIEHNWYGTIKEPNFHNQLVEYHMFGSDENHIDNSPLILVSIEEID